jgi:hypothetical protein
MADVYSAIILDDDYWDGTELWAGETSQANRDSKYSTRRYTSMSAWAADRASNSSSGNTEYGIIIGPWVSRDSGKINFVNWNADAIFIYCPISLPDGTNLARHNGIFENISNSYTRSNTDEDIIVVNNETVTIDGVQFFIDATSSGSIYSCIGCGTADAGKSLTVRNCVLEADPTNSVYLQGIDVDDSNLDVVIENVVANAPRRCFMLDSYNSCMVYNCIATGASAVDGIKDNGTGATIKNTISFNNRDDWDGVSGLTYCVGDDSDTSSGTGNIQWTSGATDWAANFNNYSNGDFTPLDNDLPGAGIGPLSDANVPTTDIIGNARSGSTCTIGPFEYQAGGWTGKICGVTNPAKINGITVAGIAKVCGI